MSVNQEEAEKIEFADALKVDDSPVYEFIMDFYIDRLKAGWDLTTIDNTDFLHWIDISVYQTIKEYRARLVKLDDSKY
ncbi:hypothetical protein COE80_19490 [Bacillus pseudomycoides]|uniref:hypothetical protein n=1 Tax=Bacillus pseudomycoides TaxID=64104 RepID=UPI000BFDF944|nr:hypothetical protein [Bacillus pseudomycoides]PHB23098.1 hypothetical protein COE80_19490 [Bacillus pseudomycoides]PHE37627.1 hypothetical protein COF51_16455 [Bacillus pseudomycoides]